MNVPHILVVDDQFARNATERNLFLEQAGLIEVGSRLQAAPTAVAEAMICAGQRKEGNRLINDYRVALDAASQGGWAVVLLDIQFDSGEMDAAGRPAGQAGDDVYGKTILEHLNASFPDLPVVMLSGKRHAEIGHLDIPYLSKFNLTPYDLRRALLRFGALSMAAAHLALGLGDQVLASDPASIAAFRQAFVHAGTDVSILVLGESGVGKEVLARYVHQASNRRAKPFVALNVAAIPRDLVESELFGIGKNVATGVSRREGKFDLASGGTLFLDEIGDG